MTSPGSYFRKNGFPLAVFHSLSQLGGNPMKLLPSVLILVLILAVIGCGNRRSRDNQMSKQIRQWVPMWTSLKIARQAMEKQKYDCSITSYDSLDQMNKSHGEVFPDEDDLWSKYVNQKRQLETATNITHLTCKTAKFEVVFLFVNDRQVGFYFPDTGS